MESLARRGLGEWDVTAGEALGDFPVQLKRGFLGFAAAGQPGPASRERWENSWGSFGKQTKPPQRKEQNFSDIQIQEEAEEGRRDRAEPESLTSAGPSRPLRGCGIQMWPGKEGRGGRTGGGGGLFAISLDVV